MDTKPSYRSFLLRLWRREGDPNRPYVLLEDPLTGKRVGFSSLEALVTYLQTLYDELVPDGSKGNEPDEINATEQQRENGGTTSSAEQSCSTG